MQSTAPPVAVPTQQLALMPSAHAFSHPNRQQLGSAMTSAGDTSPGSKRRRTQQELEGEGTVVVGGTGLHNHHHHQQQTYHHHHHHHHQQQQQQQHQGTALGVAWSPGGTLHSPHSVQTEDYLNDLSDWLRTGGEVHNDMM